MENQETVNSVTEEKDAHSVEGRIGLIGGHNRVLLVAPHGFNGDRARDLGADDINTAILTKEISDRINCYALINEIYKKPKKIKDSHTGKEFEGPPDPENKRINVNRKDQVEKYLNEEFLEPLKGSVQKIIEEYGSAIIFWIHGIDDANINGDSVAGDPLNVHVLIGIGQGNIKRPTAKEQTVNRLISCLSANGNRNKVSGALAKEGSYYCGNDTNTMTQYFRENYPLSEVESIQLEIKYTGFRESKDITSTAEAFSDALSKLIAPKELQKMEESHPDEELVTRARSKLSEIFSLHFEKAMMEAGQYLIDEFYGGDIEKARKKEPVKGKSFFQLISQLHPKENGGPSKTWVYDAINIVVAEQDLSDFPTYGNIGLSQKKLLLPVDDRQLKEKLIEEISQKGLTVAELREEIAKTKKVGVHSTESKPSLTRAISNPQVLFSEEYSTVIGDDSLMRYNPVQLRKLQERALEKTQEIEASIRDLIDQKNRYISFIQRIESVNEAKGGKKNVKAQPIMKTQHFKYEGKTGMAESKGFQKKQLADFACNIGNICQFGCTFCYVPSVVTKQKGVQNILKEGYGWDEISHYRTKENMLSCVERDLKKIEPGDRRTVIFCTTCDPCATEEHADITISAIRLIMESSELQVRVLSKSTLILEIAKTLDLYRERIVYGLSTGTIRPAISASIEGNASPIRERLKILDLIQGVNIRTFGMLCPILPSEMPYLDELIDAINVDKCEHVWAEALNVRGKSLVKTRDQLMNCGLEEDAKSLQQVMGNKANWREYSKELFLKVRGELEKRGAEDKLRFLQYVTRQPAEFVNFFKSQKGALCL